jgi:hypothetical protein
MTMPYFISPSSRLAGPLPRRDILAVCEFLNRTPERPKSADSCTGAAEILLDRLAAAARMQ